jgi:gliding motility associated protien GldN
MRTLKILLLFIGITFLLKNGSYAQLKPVLDGAYGREHVPLQQAPPLQEIREADGMYSKKVMRYIDVKEKRNHPLFFSTQDIVFPAAEGIQPERMRVSLFSLMTKSIKDGLIPAYFFDPRDMTTQWWKSELEGDAIQNVDQIETIITQASGNQVKVPKQIKNEDVVGFYVWEEWVFDKQRSVMDVRIISIAPQVYTESDGTIALYWVYYPHLESIFKQYETYNQGDNDAAILTYRDIFLKRVFNSIVYATTNVYDNRPINAYLLGIDAIREGERIQGQIFTYEHDQWEY